MNRFSLSLWVSTLFLLSLGIIACNETQEHHWPDLLTQPDDLNESQEVNSSYSSSEIRSLIARDISPEDVQIIDLATSGLTVPATEIESREKGVYTASDFHIFEGPLASTVIQEPMYHIETGPIASNYNEEKLFHIPDGPEASNYQVWYHVDTGPDWSNYTSEKIYHIAYGPHESEYSFEKLYHITSGTGASNYTTEPPGH